jgi:hypothetical protein
MSEPYAAVKEKLQKEIWPEPINSKVWRDLVSTEPHWAKRAADGKLSLEELVRLYWQKVEIYASASWSKGKERQGKPDERQEALALIAALEAPRVAPEMIGWRERVLGNRLLAMSDLPGWLHDQAEREGEPADGYLLYPYSYDAEMQHPTVDLLGWLALRNREGLADWLRAEAERIEHSTGDELPSVVLEAPLEISCAVPGRRPLQLLIRRDGELARLKAIAAQLRPFLKWPEHYAVTFVLTGVAPPLPPWTLSVADAAFPALRRLIFELDPRLSGAEVARLYNEARAGLRSGRDKPMSEKHLNLAIFTAAQQRSGHSWRELREAWNTLVGAEGSGLSPEYAYQTEGDPTARRFGLDCRTAWMRLTGQRWPGLSPQLTDKRKMQMLQAIDPRLASIFAESRDERKERG